MNINKGRKFMFFNSSGQSEIDRVRTTAIKPLINYNTLEENFERKIILGDKEMEAVNIVINLRSMFRKYFTKYFAFEDFSEELIESVFDDNIIKIVAHMRNFFWVKYRIPALVIPFSTLEDEEGENKERSILYNSIIKESLRKLICVPRVYPLVGYHPFETNISDISSNRTIFLTSYNIDLISTIMVDPNSVIINDNSGAMYNAYTPIDILETFMKIKLKNPNVKESISIDTVKKLVIYSSFSKEIKKPITTLKKIINGDIDVSSNLFPFKQNAEAQIMLDRVIELDYEDYPYINKMFSDKNLNMLLAGIPEEY